MIDKNKIIREARIGREEAEAERESYVTFHNRQKEAHHLAVDRNDNYETSAGINLDSMSRLRVYVALTDPNLGVFLNDAKVKAKHAYLSGTRNWHHHYVIDVADVDIKLRGRAVHIKISPADAFWFEFASSGKPVTVDVVTQDGVSVPAYKGCMVGVSVSTVNNALVTRAKLLSRPEEVITGGGARYRSMYGQELSRVKRPFQAQLQSEPVAYPRSEFKYGRIRTKNTLMESYAPPHAWSGVTLRCTDGPYATFGSLPVCGPGVTFAARDIGYDVPYMDNVKAEPVRTAYIRDTADWPRACGKQMVESANWGEREFAIYVDAFNQFAIFPTAGIEPLHFDPYEQNVQETLVRRLTPALPAWAWVPTTKAKDYWAATPNVFRWCVDQPETDWKFHPKGTHCAAILFEREPFTFDSTFWSTDATPTQPFNSTKFATLTAWFGSQVNYTQSFAPDTYNAQRYFIAPGVVELEVKITITGPSINQYTAELVVTELRRPSTSYRPEEELASRWAMFIDYVGHDIPKRKGTTVEVKAGTLVALDLEYWLRPAGTLGDATERQMILSCREIGHPDPTAPTAPIPAGRELFSVIGAPVLAIDLTTLSLVLRLDAYSTDRVTPPGGDTLNFPVHHFGAWIIHSGVSKEVLYPENIPPEIKLRMETYTKLNGREYLNERMRASSGGWFYMPVSTGRDTWSDTSLANYRQWWACEEWYWYDQFFALLDPDLNGFGFVQYKTTGSGYPTDGNATVTWLRSIGGDYGNLFFCTQPRWGWHQYSTYMTLYMNVIGNTTFFAHPNGTYAFWSDGWLYDRNGLPGDYVNATGAGGSTEVGQGSGADYTNNTLAVYDPNLIEHVIFDVVHFEIRAKDQPARRKRTSFRELYNRAVAAAKEDGSLTLVDNLLPIELVDMRATFIKEIGTDVINEFEFLDLKATWDGGEWWYRESAYSWHYGATPLPVLVGSASNFNNINLYCFWRTTTFAGAGIAYPPGSARNVTPNLWHIRFANPLIIMEK